MMNKLLENYKARQVTNPSKASEKGKDLISTVESIPGLKVVLLKEVAWDTEREWFTVEWKYDGSGSSRWTHLHHVRKGWEWGGSLEVEGYYSTFDEAIKAFKLKHLV